MPRSLVFMQRRFFILLRAAVIAANQDIQNRINLIKNFGFDGPENIPEIGLNGKMSEAHAAMGIVNLRYVDECTAKRKLIFEAYSDLLSDCLHIELMNLQSTTTKFCILACEVFAGRASP